MGSTARVAAWSGVLAAASFVGVMVFAPVDVPRLGMTEATRDTSVQRQAARIRRAMGQGRNMAALSIAHQTVELFPDDPDAWLWKAITEHAVGDSAEAREAGVRLSELIGTEPEPGDPFSGSARAYRVAWAAVVQGDRPGSRPHFLEAAALYEPATVGLVDEAIRRYNLACYLGMGGEIERAAEQFALAVDAGYAVDAGWWLADPDLDPIREHRLYRDASVVLQRAREEAERDAREQRERAEREMLGPAPAETPNEPAGGQPDGQPDNPAGEPGGGPGEPPESTPGPGPDGAPADDPPDPPPGPRGSPPTALASA